ncbi:MAG: histidine kinase, partial [Flavobacterium sp.]|nr:histidine kinase [Flavobacterium sp.]
NLLQQSKKLQVSNQELEQFAYVASHDLQEPLRMVTSFLTLIENKYNDKLDEKGREYIKFAVEGAKNMRQIILSLLSFSLITDNETGYENIALSEIINEVNLLQSKLISDKKAIIIIDNLPDVYAPRQYMIQLFQNIISNALKYSNNNVSCVIKITSKNHKNYFVVSVADNGIGIDKEYFDKIFVIFQRLHHEDEYQGNGMGLAITKKIMEKLNGKIWVESAIGLGSTFNIMIPKNNKKT